MKCETFLLILRNEGILWFIAQRSHLIAVGQVNGEGRTEINMECEEIPCLTKD